MSLLRKNLVVLALALMASLPSGAATVDVQSAPDGARVVLNGQPVIALRSSNAGMTPLQRAAVAAKRLQDMIAAGQPVSKLSAKPAGAGAGLFWGQQVIAYAIPGDAYGKASDTLPLASAWAKQIAQQLSLPPVRIVERSLTVPFKEARKTVVRGSSPGPYQVTVEPAAMAAVAIEPGGIVSVTGAQTGRGLLKVTTPEGSDQIPLRVAKYAGAFSGQGLQAVVTGSSVPSEVVAEAAWRAARNACTLEPGTWAVVSLLNKPQGLTSGEGSRQVPVSIKIDGPGYLISKTNGVVDVRRQAPLKQTAEVLFYSNNPEQVPTPQPLFSAPMVPGQAARLLYHHQNGSGRKMRVSVVLANVGDEDADVHLMGAVAEPRVDTILVGYRAGAQFLQDLTSGVGYVSRIRGGTRITLWTGVLAHMETASGIVQMAQVSSTGKLVARVISEDGSVVRSAQDIDPVGRGDIEAMASAHQYPSPAKQLTEQYVAGDRWLFIRLGKLAIADASSKGKLDGNYGVLYNIDLTLSNPTEASRQFHVMFDATAGIAGVASMIDGRFSGKSHVQTHREVPLATFTLSPGEKRQVNVTTLPLAGSNYPATIVVRS